MNNKIALFNIADFTNKSRFSSLGLAYMTSYLQKYSGREDIYILEEKIEYHLRRIRPDIIGISSVTQTFADACSVAHKLKKDFNNIPLIIGGSHISALPHTLPSVFDIAVVGEGEETMKELMAAISEKEVSPELLAKIKGIAFHVDGKTEITPPRDFIYNLDNIPYPVRSLSSKTPFHSIITSRGCPYKCIFCSSSEFWKMPRFHSPEYVVGEMEQLIQKHGAIHISVWDDLFIADKERLRKICDLIIKNKINKRVSFGCALRSNLVDEDLCNSLKKMNINRVSIGFESGSDKILNQLKCGTVSVKDHYKAVELCKKYGFFITGTFMIGSPNENVEDLHKTLELIRKLKLTGGGSISLTVPFPGTHLWDYAKQKKLVSENMDFSKISLMSTDFSDPKGFKGILLTDSVPKDDFFHIAQEMQKESNRYYLTGLFNVRNFSFKSIRFIIARPKEALAIIKFAIRFLLRKASLMERYVFYYKKT